MSRICLVGCGGIARVHARNLRERAELSFYSRSEASAARFQQEFGGRAWGAYDEVLSSDVDAVVVCTPPGEHCGQTVAALAAGKAVLVEKPMCVTPQELAILREAAVAHPDRPLMVAENYHYKPSLRLLQWLLGEGYIGRLERLEVRKLSTQAASGWKEGYGALLEGGIHFVALVSALVGAAPERVSAEFPGRRPPAPERRSHLRLRYADGVDAELQYAWDTPALLKGTCQHSRLYGSQGRIVFESNGLYVGLRGTRRRLYFPGLRDLMGYRAMTDDFLACLGQDGRVPLYGLQQAGRDLNIVFAAYGSAEESP